LQALQQQVREFPEQLRREKAAMSAQVEELHSRAVSSFADRSVDAEKRLQLETRRADAAESQLKVARDQLSSSNDSLHALQSQLSQSESEWREEFDAVQQQLLEQVAEAESMIMQLQAQAARADEATARCRQAEAEVQQCRHTMQLDAGRLQVRFKRGFVFGFRCCY
jgi:hypothetical protein